MSPMAEDAITRGGIGGLGSLVYIYGFITPLHNFHGSLILTDTANTGGSGVYYKALLVLSLESHRRVL